MPKEEKELEPIFSPGMLDVPNKVVFEQVNNGKYALSDNGWVKDKPDDKLTSPPYQNHFPLERTAWFLVDKPLIYGTASELWKEIRQFIYEHLFLPDENLYDVLTAWVFASWIPELWNVIPYIFFYGPVASGKTRGLEILHRLSYRAIISSNISTAALFRACESWHPTLILDETEIYNKADRSEVVGLLNSGYRRGQYAIRVKTTEKGEFLETFDVFGFKALAGTQALAKTLESRSIMIRMIKNRRRVKLHVDDKKADDLRAKLLYWRLTQLSLAELSELSEVFLAKVGNLEFDSGRLEELFQCLLAVANDGRENILKYAKKMAEIRQFEEMTSLEATVVEAMLKDETLKQNNVILTKDITETINKTRSEKEKFKTRSIGWIIRRLGFEPRHTEKGNGWFFDIERLKYLSTIYLGTTTTPEKSSETSETSAQQTPFFEHCYFCGNPIMTDDWVADEFTAHKPTHRECYDKQKAMTKKNEHEPFNPNLYGTKGNS